MKPVTGPRYSTDEDRSLTEAWNGGMNPEQIVEAGLLPNRSIHSIRGRLASLGLFRPSDQDPGDGGRVFQAKLADAAFAAMMMAAIEKGKERVKPGTFIDDRPFTGVRLQPEPFYSCCGSSAGLCAEFGTDDGVGGPIKS